MEVAQTDARVGDIVVWRDGNNVKHSAILTAVVLNGNNFDVNQTRFNSKNGNEAFAPNQTLAQINGKFPNTTITVYTGDR